MTRNASLILATVCTLLLPAAARAHGGLKSSVPAKASSLTTAPKEIRLNFSEAAELAFTRIELSGPNGRIALGAVEHAVDDKRTVTAAVQGPLVAGQYTVTWQTAGADGHPVRGNYVFSIASQAAGLAGAAPISPLTDSAAASGAGASSGVGGAPVHHDPDAFPDAGGFNAESPLYVGIRWLQFAAMLVLTGAVAFHLFVLGFLRRKQRPDSPMLLPASQRAARIGRYAAMLLGAVVVVRLLAQSYAMHAPGTGFAPALMLSMIGLTTWGWGWLLQAVATVIAITGFSLVRTKPRKGWTIATVGAVLGAFSPALSGHAASAPTLRPLAILADGLHIIGASGWLGSLLILLVAGIPAAMALDKDERGPAVADLVNAFSPTALAFAGLTATAGVFAAWLHLGAIPALWQTQYGRTLLVKLAILGIVTATGAYNFLYVKPRLGKLDGVRNIKRSAMIEVGVAAVVLLVTAVLVATPPAMDMAAMAVTALMD